MVKIGVVIFPGSNCDSDLIKVLQTRSPNPIVRLWHKETDLQSCSHLFLPGGFSYGDYLRSGAIAKLSPIMQTIKTHAENGGFVMGICNGFQILCESGLLPGALLRNTNMRFVCKNIYLVPGNKPLNPASNIDQAPVLCVPIAHGEGRYFCDNKTLSQLEENQQVLYRYSNKLGAVSMDFNPNGSLNNIAGVCNSRKNVFGMMPHPERCATNYLLNLDGLKIFNAVFGGGEDC